MEIEMPKTISTVFGVLLIAASAFQVTIASAHQIRRTRVAMTNQIRNANNSLDSVQRAFCSQEAGNPHDVQTDYLAWSAWRALGAWDSRNDCP
jgi:hypothetical protein